jgi:hypothetical protein
MESAAFKHERDSFVEKLTISIFVVDPERVRNCISLLLTAITSHAADPKQSERIRASDGA